MSMKKRNNAWLRVHSRTKRGLVLFSPFVNEYTYHHYGQCQNDVANFVAVSLSQVGHLLRRAGWIDAVNDVAQQGEHAVPDAGTECGVEQE